jgi:ATP-binding cassette subfamily F protein uup
VRHGTNLEVSYFDQLRTQLDDTQTLFDNVGQGSDTITINGKVRNIVGYLEGFLFSRERVHAPISALSGGERNRLLLARLFAHPANLLVVDEPTNDLDIETLELLEDLLLEYSGTLLLVSHDRAFLNNLVTSTLILDQNGRVREYVGGYDDWQRQKQVENGELSEEKKSKSLEATRKGGEKVEAAAQKKQSHQKQRELEDQRRELANLPTLIEALEAEQHQLSSAMTQPEFYQRENAKITQAANRLKELEEELSRMYRRWEELEHS